MIVRNSWILYRTTKAPEDPELDLLAFRQEIANVYLTKNALSWNQSGSLQGTILSAKRRVKDEVRYNPGWPLPESFQEKKRCDHCGKNTRKSCPKRSIELHDYCFYE